MNFSKCMQTDSSAGEASPKWGTCVLYFMLRNAGVPAGAIVSNEEEVERRRCYAKTVHLSQKRLMEESTDGTRKSDRSMFARTDWYGRDCAREKTGIGNAAAMCNISSAIGSGLAPLPDTYKREAFEALRTASTNVLSNEPRAAGDKIRVLLYNRLDTNRRKWVNSEQVYQKLRRVGNVEIRYIHATPPSFIEQLRLFSWADILIAPHGAATANSIFMSSGTDIVEIWGVCSNDISDTRYLPRSWTGWHAHLLNLNLQYAQCAMQTGEADPDDATSSDGAQVVIVEGVMRLFGHALERQRFRMRHLSHSEETETRVERMTDAIERRVEFSVGRAFCISILAFGLGVLSSRRANGKGRTGQFGSPRSPKLALWKHRPCP